MDDSRIKDKYENYNKFKSKSIEFFQLSTIFLMIFSFIYFIIIPIIGLITVTIDPWGGFFDILTAFSFLSLFSLAFLAIHTRFGAFMQIVGFAYWWMVPCNWIINEFDRMDPYFLGTYYIMWIIFFILMVNAILAMIVFFGEGIILIDQKKSVLLGPGAVEKDIIKRGIMIFVILIGVAIPGLLPYFNAYTIPVKITPKDYDIKYNFWATPDIDGNYSQEVIDKFGFQTRYYSYDALDAMNTHKVNLDLTFNSLLYSDVEMLKEWESRLPDITYRIVLAAKGLENLYDVVKNATEILMECENNGTLDQWIGFCFDIEGKHFNPEYSDCGSFEDCINEWDRIFDYIDSKSLERGKIIEMESVGIVRPSIDVKFDGDTDLAKEYGSPCYTPERFSSYAPMIYRCWYEGVKPFGSAEDPSDPWSTSYDVYSDLLTLKYGVGEDKIGFYIGITNTSCYGRDLPQNEPYDWPEGENTGVSNLLRDILIAKHFGAKELTFFLAWSWPENNYSMGGLFESYGDNFLDIVNDTVNTNPPESFNVYYNHQEAQTSEKIRYDWVYDFSRPIGILQIIGLWVVSILIVYYKNKKR